MAATHVQLLLADNDIDDCFLFSEALLELAVATHLTTVNDGEMLMDLLRQRGTVLPDILFLDLNMPRKNGFECLAEIRRDKNLQDIPVVIYSTSFEPKMVNKLHSGGARYYIQKPAEFATLKSVIKTAIEAVITPDTFKEKFIIHP